MSHSHYRTPHTTGSGTSNPGADPRSGPDRPGRARRRPLPLTAGLAGALALTLALSACGDSGSSPSDPDTGPTIQIQGVSEGAVLNEPVTILITASPSGTSVTAELNGAPFRSGDTVGRAGSYTLEVEAFRGGRTTSETVRFSLEPTGERAMTFTLFDLGPQSAGGGGDAILLADSSSLGFQYGLVDAGPFADRPGLSIDDLDFRFVADQLLAMGVDTLEFVQLTHPHMDHVGGLTDVLRDIHVRYFVYNGQVRNFIRYQEAMVLAEQRADSVFVPSEPWVFELGGPSGIRTTHIPGLPFYLGRHTNSGRELNEGSLGTLVEFDGVRLFLTGDGEDEANLRWRSQFPELSGDLDILKVGHHGANNAIFDDRTGFTSTRSSWLEHTTPQVMVVSANGTTHPRIRANQRMTEVPNAELYCTNVHGTIRVRVVGGAWTVTTERNADMDCVPGADAPT